MRKDRIASPRLMSFSGNESLEDILNGLDPLMIALGLALAASAPGPAGEAGAVAAISYDVSQRRWYGAVLSAISMIPVAGYLAAFLKVGLLLAILNRRVKVLEDRLPELHKSPENIKSLRQIFGKYYRRLPRMRVARPLRARLEHIMALDPSGFSRVDEIPSSPETSVFLSDKDTE